MKLTEAGRDRAGAAFHEAGHAVAVVLAGGRIAKAELYDSGDTPGSCTHVDLPDHAEASVAYAGRWCEARARYGPEPRLDEIEAVIAANRSDHDESSLPLADCRVRSRSTSKRAGLPSPHWLRPCFATEKSSTGT